MNVTGIRLIEIRGRTATETEVIVRAQCDHDNPCDDATWASAVEAFEALAKCLAACKTSTAPVEAFT